MSRTAAAYGLRIDGIPSSGLALAGVPNGWPTVRVRQSHEENAPAGYQVTAGSVSIPLITGGRLEVDREDMLAHFRVPAPLPLDELLHPYFAPAAAWFSHWLGRHCFHAGAVVVSDKAYAVIGDKEAGKSSLLAWLAGAGATILADDLVVVASPAGGRPTEDSRVLTGPRSIDLRLPTVEMLRQTAAGTLVRGDTRHRLALPQTTHEWPLGGWIFLRWREALSVDAVPPRDRVRRLSEHRVFRLPPLNPADLVAFAALPTWELARPRGWELMDDVVALLSATLGGRG